jgi:hypothetical protein
MTAAEIAALIGRGRFDLSRETSCQADIATLLAAEGVAFRREHRLGAHARLDFLAEGGVALAATIGGKPAHYVSLGMAWL